MTMSNLLRALTLVGVICAIQGLLEYRCDVLGCGASETCDATSHDCTNCANGNFGVPCTLAGACTSPNCVAANTITNTIDPTNKCSSSAATKCICKEGYYGDKCQLQRVRATCVTGQPLKIYVAPYLKAGNSIKVYYARNPASFNGNLATITCKQDALSDGEYKKEDLPQDSSPAAGGCEPAILDTDGNQVYYVYLQQAHPYRTTADQIFKVICDPTTAVEISVQTVSQLDVGSPVDETSSAVAGILMKVRTELTPDTDIAEIAPGAGVTIGTQLAITFEHQGPIMATVCKVTDGATATTAQDLIVASCVPQTAEALYWSAIQVSSPSDAVTRGGTLDYNMIKLRIRAFRFQGTAASLKVTCTICKDQTCVGGGGTGPTCTQNTLSAEMLAVYDDLPTTFRRRRDVTGLETQTNLTVALTVVDGQVVITNGNDGLSNGSTDVGNCYKSTSVLLPIILLVVLLLVAMVMTFFFCRRLTNELERKESETNMAYK